MTSIFLATFQLTLLLHSVIYPSPSGHAALQNFSMYCSAWAASILGWFHSSSGRAAPVCCVPWDTALCWAGLVTAFGTLWGAQTWRALLYPLLHRQPSQNPAVPSKPSKTSQFAALADLICLLLFGFACLGEVCAFCRQRGGGGWGWQGRWRTWWYTEYIEQCIMYWVMQQPEN